MSAVSTPNVSSGHMPSGGRNVASVSFAPIEEISTHSGVHADANFNFQGFSGWADRRQPGPQPLPNVGGNLDAPSSTFVALMSQEQASSDITKPNGTNKGAFQNLLSKAIHAYEGTALVINGGGAPRRGSTLSMTL